VRLPLVHVGALCNRSLHALGKGWGPRKQTDGKGRACGPTGASACEAVVGEQVGALPPAGSYPQLAAAPCWQLALAAGSCSGVTAANVMSSCGRSRVLSSKAFIPFVSGEP
jgi:hypothetical protein